MGIQKQEKLNWLQRSLPEGLVADAAWLEKMGYSGALRKKYVAHGWLDRVARGVYRRPSPRLPEEGEEKGLSWESVVISLQTLLKAHFVVGGRTALELQGFAHYLSSTPQREVHLYGTDRRPGWVLKLNLESRFVFHNAKRLFPNNIVLDRRQRGKRSARAQQLRAPKMGKMGLAACAVVIGARNSRATRRVAGTGDLPSSRHALRRTATPESTQAAAATSRVPQRQGEATVPVVRRAASTALAQRAGSWRDRSGQRQARASKRGQARP